MSVRLVACGGVDSSGAAGLDVDASTARALGVDLQVVATCYTEQDHCAVRSVVPVDPAAWVEEVRPADAIKFGLLPGPGHLRAAAALIRELGIPAVVDPVVASTSGYVFLDEAALEVLREELLPAGPVLTPNLPEAQALTGLADREAAAARLLELGARAVVLKGGHGPEPDQVCELILLPDAEPIWHTHPRLPGSLRGTGCRFATALAAGLAAGDSILGATQAATTHVASCFPQG
jgi:hydroxymethylpyrimidine/phosphomethylpyrimidine kinase